MITSNFNSSKYSQASSSSLNVSWSGIFLAVSLACRSPYIRACPEAVSYNVLRSRLSTSGPKMFVWPSPAMSMRAREVFAARVSKSIPQRYFEAYLYFRNSRASSSLTG